MWLMLLFNMILYICLGAENEPRPTDYLWLPGFRPPGSKIRTFWELVWEDPSPQYFHQAFKKGAWKLGSLEGKKSLTVSGGSFRLPGFQAAMLENQDFLGVGMEGPLPTIFRPNFQKGSLEAWKPGRRKVSNMRVGPTKRNEGQGILITNGSIWPAPRAKVSGEFSFSGFSVISAPLLSNRH